MSEVRDLYRGRDPRHIAAYAISEAAHYLQLPPATLRSWVAGRSYPTREGARFSAPLIEPAQRDGLGVLLSFTNLAEAHALAALRRVHHIAMDKVRLAIKRLADRYHSPYPLIDRRLLTDGVDLFVKELGELENLSRPGQLAMRQVLESYLRRIEHASDGLPARLYPFTRRTDDEEERSRAPKIVVIDPTISFGRPVVSGTGIPTAILAERFFAGDSLADLASDYEIPADEIEEAIRCERERLAA